MNENPIPMKITIIGTGYVGLVSGACFAELGNEVMCLDINTKIISQLKKAKVSFFEPDLQKVDPEKVEQTQKKSPKAVSTTSTTSTKSHKSRKSRKSRKNRKHRKKDRKRGRNKEQKRKRKSEKKKERKKNRKRNRQPRIPMEIEESKVEEIEESPAKLSEPGELTQLFIDFDSSYSSQKSHDSLDFNTNPALDQSSILYEDQDLV